MTYQAVIFDLDGVLCHTDEYHYLARKKLADGFGLRFDRRTNSRPRGISRMASLEIILSLTCSVRWRHGDPMSNRQTPQCLMLSTITIPSECSETLAS